MRRFNFQDPDFDARFGAFADARRDTPETVDAAVREVLEGYLDDDQDMKDMNLTAKEQHAAQQAAEAQVRSGGGNGCT